MSELRAFELSDTAKKVVGGAAATIIGGFVIGFGIGYQNTSQNEVRTWLQNRGIADCNATNDEAPCVTDVGQTNTWAEIIRPNSGSIIVNCYFSDSPMAPTPGCYVDLPDNFNNPNDQLITGPETVLQA